MTASEVEEFAWALNEQGAGFDEILKLMGRRGLLKRNSQLDYLKEYLSPKARMSPANVNFLFYVYGLTESEIAFLASGGNRNCSAFHTHMFGIMDVLYGSGQVALDWYWDSLIESKEGWPIPFDSLYKRYQRHCAEREVKPLPEIALKGVMRMRTRQEYLEKHEWRPSCGV